MKRYILIFLIVIIGCVFSTKLFPISNRAARLGTYITTGISAVVSFGISKYKKMDNISSLFFTTSSLIFSAIISKYILFKLTPASMFNRAVNILKGVESDSIFYLAMNYYDDPIMLIESIYEEYFYSELPLIEAFNKFVYMRLRLNHARLLLVAAKKEGIEYLFSDNFSKCCNNIDEYIGLIDRALVIIRKDVNWIDSINARDFQESGYNQLNFSSIL